MRQPDIWDVTAIKGYSNSKAIPNATGGPIWIPARPEPHNAFSWRWRFKLAWMVFTGKADCMTWGDSDGR